MEVESNVAVTAETCVGCSKLHLDFIVSDGIGRIVDEQNLRGLFTEIGCVMEDASMIALVWQTDDAVSTTARAAKLRDAHERIGALLDIIEVNVR
jgi:hypothetical protein